MKSYYAEISNLIDQDYKGRVNNFCTGVELTPYSPTLFSKIKSFFSKKKKKEEVKSSNYSFTPTLHSYCGADLVVSVGPKIIGELTNIRWYTPNQCFLDQLEHSDYYDKELAMKKPVVVMAEWVLFDKDVFGEGLENEDIVLTYANEYGQSAYRSIYGISSLYNISGTGIDDIVTSNKMILAAEKVTELKPGVVCTK